MDQHKLTLTERELSEIKRAMFYNAFCNHGTVGHNMLVLIAKLAIDRGFVCKIVVDGVTINAPADVEISE